jgi:PAS domain S-box-containing protein
MALASDETQQLRRTLRDLVALSALSAVWVDQEPARVAEDLAEVLLRVLGLEFALVRLTGLIGEGTSETIQAFQPASLPSAAEAVLQALAPWLDAGAAPRDHRGAAIPGLPNPVGDGWVQLVCLPIGYGGECGIFVAGSRQPGFPTDEDSLLIGIALNQAAVTLQCRRTERAIQEVERARRRMAALVEGCEDAVISKDLEGLIESWNPGAERLYGYAAEEVLGKPITLLLPPEHPDEFPAIMARIARGERIEPYDTVRVRQDGTRIHVSLSISPIKGADGAVVGASIIARDITERRRAERLRAVRLASTQILAEASTLREAAPRLLQAVCDRLGWDVGAVWTVDPQARVLRCLDVWASPATRVPEFEAITRQSTFEPGMGLPGRIWASGQATWITDVPTDPNFPRGPVAQREGLRGAFGFPIRLGANVLGVIEFFSHEIREPDADLLETAATLGGQVGQFLERRRAEEALRESEERLRLLAETIPSIIWTAAPDGTVTYANESWFRYTGLTPEQNARDWPRYVLHPDDRERCFAQWTQALAEGTEYEIEVRNRRHDGEYRWFLTRAVPARDAEGRVTAWFGTTTDIDDRKRAETAQRVLYARLQESDRRKDEFLAMLGHELRNPLAPIRNAIHLLKQMEPVEPRRTRPIEIIERQVTHQVRLVDDLLDVSRISRGKIRLCLERLDLVSLVRDTSEDARSLLDAAGLNLSLELPTEPVWVEGDATRLSQVLGNLLQNAAKFTDRGGRVTVRLAVEERGKDLTTETRRHGAKHTEKDDLEAGRTPAQASSSVYSSVSPCLRGEKGVGYERAFAVITVCDTGIGIAPEMLPHVFERFAQVDDSLDRSRGGLGLGLALVKGLMELHGGDVRAESEGVGHGTTFTLRLPLARGAAAPETPGAPAEAPPGRLRILIVDDIRDAADSLGEVLELAGYTVTVAYSGPEALEVARQLRSEVVLCDLGLPGMDGYAVAAALRQDPVTAGARLIALSGYGQEEDQRRSREAGFDLHLTKPVEFEVLQRLLAAETEAP